MKLEQICTLFERISETSSTKAKQNILETYKDDELLKKVFYYTYNPFMNYGISETMMKNLVYDKTAVLQQDIFAFLDKLAENNINNELRQEFVDICSSLNEKERKVFLSIVRKDLRIGVNVGTANKVFNKMIPTFNVQLANKLQDVKLDEDELIFITEKLDGVRCIAIKENNVVTLYSRQGKQISGLVDVEQALLKVKGDWVFDGELLLKTDKDIESGTLYRMTVKAVNNKQDIKTGIMFNVFDVLTPIEFRQGVSKTKYSQRRQNLELINRCVLREMEFVKIVKLLYVGENHTMIAHYLKEMENLDKEGVMVNREDFYYCKRCNSLLKVKSMNTCDARVIDLLEGLGKNSNKLGAITIEFTHNGKTYACNVGSGFKESERQLYWNNPQMILGKIVEITYFEISQNQNKEYSLRFPVWSGRIRNDKDEISMY